MAVSCGAVLRWQVQPKEAAPLCPVSSVWRGPVVGTRNGVLSSSFPEA